MTLVIRRKFRRAGKVVARLHHDFSRTVRLETTARAQQIIGGIVALNEPKQARAVWRAKASVHEFRSKRDSSWTIHHYHPRHAELIGDGAET